MADVAPLQPGDPRELGGYRLVGRIGEGGQGTVYMGRAPAGEAVAVKLLRAGWTRDPAARGRLAREVAAAGRVAPFCTARVLAAQLEDDDPFIVSEFIDGPSLQEVVADSGPLAGPALDRLAVGTATALSAIHQAGVVHRDFKPGNVVLGPDGPRVIDFGIARAADMTATMTNHVIGTPGYMAPEVVRGEAATPAADVFAWAATIAYAATGSPPFHATNVAAIIHKIISEEPDLGALGGPLRGLVARCLAKDPAGRLTALQVLVRLLGQPEEQAAVPEVAMAGQGAPGQPQLPAAQAALEMGNAAAHTGVIAPPWQQPPTTDRAPWAVPRPGVTYPQAPDQAPWAMQRPGVTYPQQPDQAPWAVQRPGVTYPQAPDQAPWAVQRPGGGPQAAPRRRWRAGRWAIVIAGLAVLGVAAAILVPGLAGRNSPSGTSGSHAQGVASTVPAAFAGFWLGRAEQPKGVVRSWTATLILTKGKATGDFTVTGLCIGLVKVTSATATQLVLSETRTTNPTGQCAPAGTISLNLVSPGRASLTWREAGDAANSATGTFVRV